MIDSNRMAVVDENAAALGVPRKQLMESSGNAIANAVRSIADKGARVTICCGRGNNGGDGMVAARFLESTFSVEVVLLGRSDTLSTEITRENWQALEQAEIPRTVISDASQLQLPASDIIVDAMLGTGVAGALREPIATAAQQINDQPGTVVAVDVPTGLDPDTGDRVEGAIEADRVVTFHDMKPGLETISAPVEIADIGIPSAAERFVERGDRHQLSRDPESHKGDNGSILVIGGGPYSGAPALAGQASLRAGADLAFIACPEKIEREVQGYSENLIVEGFAGDYFKPSVLPSIRERAASVDVVVLGPGLGSGNGQLDAVERFLEDFEGVCIVDADALEAVPSVESSGTLICTPHAGELRKMGGPAVERDWHQREAVLPSFADDLGITILLKGRYDVVSNGFETRINRTGNPGMTVGGTGDVLAGVCGALASQLPPIDAAAVGAHVNGRAGDIVAQEHTSGLVASDLLETLPMAIWKD